MSTAGLGPRSAAVNHLRHGAIIAEWGASPKRGYRLFDARETLRTALVESLTAKEFAAGVLGLGYAVRNHHQPVTRFQLQSHRIEFYGWNQSYRQIALFQLGHRIAGNQKWRNMAAVDEFKLSVRKQAGDDQRRVFLSADLLEQEPV